MNYEELLAARNDGKKHPVMLPIGANGVVWWTFVRN